MSAFLETSISYLKGVGPVKADLLQKELGIYTFLDLLTLYPFRYVDKSKIYKISELNSEMQYVQITGKILKFDTLGQKGSTRFVVKLTDGTGVIDLIWFKGIKWIKPAMKVGGIYLVFGKPTAFNGRVNFAHPEIEEVLEGKVKSGGMLQPVYASTEKLGARSLNSRGIEKLVRTLIAQISGKVVENLSEGIIQERRLLYREQAIIQVHIPQTKELLAAAIHRLKFEELFFVQMELLTMKVARNIDVQGFVFSEVGNLFNSFYGTKLPFNLTNAQKKVLKEIRKDFGCGKQMNRLLQGDVGSGKTIVALLSMLIALDNGYQAALMAPTEILANQHMQGIQELLEGLGIEVALLTGSTKTSERKRIHEGLISGAINILIGTHALLEDKVVFKNLGYVVIDEQHRFGVAQRAKMWKKNTSPPHMLVMTATPIPRTLAMTFYGDLDVSVIDELPPGRKPIATSHRYDQSRLRVFGFMKQEIEKGRQVYIVYPLINESSTLDYKDLMDGYESIRRAFPAPKYQMSIVHGQMKPADKDFEMKRFVEGQTQILVATTVIEVGVNVPNASIMIIESAERFGLSQLHQLRGRVGRGAEQSYCILLTADKVSANGKIRMETMVRTNDGFEISEVDLKLRGPGDIMGTQQSGLLELKISDLVRDGQTLQLARDAVKNLLTIDPQLLQSENRRIQVYFQESQKGRRNWGLIS